MKSISSLTDFYYKKLYPALQDLEEQRVAVKKRVLTIGTLYSLFFTGLAFFLFTQNASIEALAFFLMIYIAGGSFLYKVFLKNYRTSFKKSIIEPLIKEIDSTLHYIPTMHVAKEHFIRSKIFTSTPDRVSGNDFVHGKIDGVPIEFSDFHAEKRHKNTHGKESWSTLFQGLFIVSEFPKHFHGTTIILPDTAQSSFGEYLGHILQENNFTRDELVKMDDPAFEKEFVVYGSDQIEARYILTHSLMKKLLHFQKRSKSPLSVSFTGKKIYLAIAYNRDLFEPSVFHSLLKYKIAMEYVATLHLAIGIVEELKLNQKLWSKQ